MATNCPANVHLPPKTAIGYNDTIPRSVENRMTTRDNQVLIRGMAAGVIIGLAIGLITAFFVIATSPELCLNFMRY